MTVTFCHNCLDAAREHLSIWSVAAVGAREGEVIVAVVLAGAGICEK